mgnify:CR=1 FL=1
MPDNTTINAFAKDFLLNSDSASVKGALGIADTSAIAGFVPNSVTFSNTSYLSIDYITNLNVGTFDFSLSFWARLDGNGTQSILNQYSGTGYSLKFSSGALVLTMQDLGGPLTATFGSNLDDNKWHVYVVSVDRQGNAVAYIDNIAQTAIPVTQVQSTLDNTGDFRIGYDGVNTAASVAFGNYMVLHRIALSAAQAAQIYFSPDNAIHAIQPYLAVDLRESTNTFSDLSVFDRTVITNGTIRYNQTRITSLDDIVIGATTPAAVTGTTITASTTFSGAIDGTVGETAPAAITGTNVLSTTTLGYKAGSGGISPTQGTDKSGEITLDKINGKMIMNSESMSANDIRTFQFTNSTIAATDVVIVNIADVGTPGNYLISVSDVSTGHCKITLKCIAGSNLTDALILNFAVIKAVQS